jgi:type IV pilus assembly protein PilB
MPHNDRPCAARPRGSAARRKQRGGEAAEPESAGSPRSQQKADPMIDNDRPKIGKLLVALKFCTVEQVKEALIEQKSTPDVKVGQILRRLGHATDEHIARALSKQQGVPYVDLSDPSKISKEVLAMAKPEQVREYGVIPVLKRGNLLTVAAAHILEIYDLDSMRFVFGCDVNWCMSSARQLMQIAHSIYGVDDAIKEAFGGRDPNTVDFGTIAADAKMDSEDEEGVVAQLVHSVISDAIKKRASDIHVEPMEDKLRIRYRVDGNCHEMECPPKRLQGTILSRIKILSGMDIAEKRKPQDGRIKTKYEERDIDLRVSALPCSHGESVVMRILDKTKNLVSIEQLGMYSADYERFEKMLKKPNGVFLVTGPTGSGKTTTLYAALQMLNRPDIKIITAEDPVEYNLEGINQSQVRHGIGLTFARILRAMLRQAPNVILVGEIRDLETAEIAIQASLTGHLVFSTLHTNDAPSSLTRLMNMGVKPFLVASAVQAILAQRLIRRLCPHCKRPYEVTDAELKSVGMTRDQVVGRTFYEPVGCNKCGGVGYRGRMGCYELLDMNTRMRQLVFEHADGMRLRQAAIENGMSPLLIDGMRKVLSGVSTVDEVLTVAHREDIG